MFLETLLSEYEVTVVKHDEKSYIFRFIDLLLFGKNFQLGCLIHIKKLFGKDLVIVQNTHMLPLAIIGKLIGIPVVLDSLDVTPYLNEYNLSRKYRFLSHLFRLHRRIYENVEKSIVTLTCNKVMCNSKYLVNYYKPKGYELLYTSYLEGLENFPHNESALLYLGIFSKEKGAYATLELARSLKCKLFVFGDIVIDDFADKTVDILLHVVKRLAQNELIHELTKIQQKFFLWGVSLIESENLSYSVQEANKDIDYLAIGAPIIGNLRLETYNKINAGCGYLATDEMLTLNFNRFEAKQTLNLNAKKLYRSSYQHNIFEDNLLNAISTI